ncbi:uncharacterized protein EKO05_0001591 [Ascochyta rabiei]|uniref:uncharacterized protein n=1 Tax=Didymella rabiei TaxID=5454 RepID=UPI00220C1AE8|nr:uncharacterized protein EKO05_0001591 [Ascochyta rabiei]UPX10961.1 hypothetical protein EKO05_0001591 [Ascochyta rabiei]
MSSELPVKESSYASFELLIVIASDHNNEDSATSPGEAGGCAFCLHSRRASENLQRKGSSSDRGPLHCPHELGPVDLKPHPFAAELAGTTLRFVFSTLNSSRVPPRTHVRKVCLCLPRNNSQREEGQLAMPCEQTLLGKKHGNPSGRPGHALGFLSPYDSVSPAS